MKFENFWNSWFFFSFKCIFISGGFERVHHALQLLNVSIGIINIIINLFHPDTLPDWTLCLECSFWWLKNNFNGLAKDGLTLPLWLNYLIQVHDTPCDMDDTVAVKVMCWFCTSRFLLKLNPHSTWAWPCNSISKI